MRHILPLQNPERKVMTFLRLLLPLLLLSSCGKDFDPDPVLLLPGEAGIVMKGDVPEMLKIKGLGDRLVYETVRKPSFQVVPLKMIRQLYLAWPNLDEDGLYIARTLQPLDLKARMDEFRKKFDGNPDVIVGSKSWNGTTVFTIRDKKQEIALTMAGPSTMLAGPLDSVIDGLKKKKALKGSENGSVLPSSMLFFKLKESGKSEMLSNLTDFKDCTLTADTEDSGTRLKLSVSCKDTEDAEKMNNALKGLQPILIFQSKGTILPEHISSRQEKSSLFIEILLTEAAMTKLLSKD